MGIYTATKKQPFQLPQMGKRGPYYQKKSHYVYTLNLEGGKKYVGYTSNLNKRMHQHFSGNGSMVTKQCKPVSVHAVNKCSSLQAAKNAERIVYHNMKNYHGTNNVRGAGHTKRFENVESNEHNKESDSESGGSEDFEEEDEQCDLSSDQDAEEYDDESLDSDVSGNETYGDEYDYDD